MAVGVPEQEVFAAADAVLERGERPTVERVRLELGRGSPARVGALLDQWWEQLAQRLRGETRLPGLPREVAQAFIEVWQQATTLAQSVAEQSWRFSGKCWQRSASNWLCKKHERGLRSSKRVNRPPWPWLRARSPKLGWLT
nr:DNA-binding protein [Pseudomonas aeruginosa]